MFKNFFVLIIFSAIILVSCNQDEITFDAPSQELVFSADTIFCDTVYHQVRSETYSLKVYNNEDKDIAIPKIALARASASLYRINIDGKAGYEFLNVPLRKKDSLYIFVEIAPTANGSESIAEEKLEFTTPLGKQAVTLFSVVQDADFYVQTNATNSNVLSGNINWTNQKAKIIFGDLTLSSGSTLNVQEGTKIYFFKNSGMKLENGATLNLNGDLGKEITIRGDRNDPKYDTIPKNWKSIQLQPGANVNMNYTRLFGGTKGLEMYQANANIRNSIIHTFDEEGIYAVNSTILAENLVMNNCRNSSVGIYKGGSYNFIHATIANFWYNNFSFGSELAVFATNEWTNANGQTEYAPLNLNIKNSIVYNQNANAIVFKPISGQNFFYQIQNCLLKHNSLSGFEMENNPNVISSISNQNPEFIQTGTEKLNLRVKDTSPTRNKGNLSIANTVPLDWAKVNRTSNPTLGAYQ